jgi:hemolysin D
MHQLNFQAKALVSPKLTIHSATSSAEQMAIQDLESESSLEFLQGRESSVVYGGVVSVTREASEELSLPQPTAQVQALASSTSIQKRQAAYWSPSLQTILDQPPSSLPRTLLISGLAFSCVLSAWAWFGQIHEVSHAQGRLIPKGEVYKIQPVTQSEISKIEVKEGQSVKAGQVIATLDDRLAIAEVDRLTQSLAGDRLQLIQTEGLMDRTRLEAETRRAIAKAEVQAQTATIAQAQAKVSTTQQILPLLQATTAAYHSRLERLKPLVAAGALAEDRLFEVEQALHQRQQEITQNQGELKQALTESDRLRAGLAEKQAEGQKSALEAQQQLQQLQIEASQLRAKIAGAETELRAAQTRLKQTFLYAPVAGTVTTLKVHNSGEVAQAGQTIAEISPAGAPLVLSALLPSREAGLVRKGMTVQIKLDSFPYQDYGIVSGKVTSVSPDAEVQEQVGAVYQVEIALDRHSVVHDHQTIPFKAGQTANAEIIVRQQRIIEVLLEPIRQIQKGGISL